MARGSTSWSFSGLGGQPESFFPRRRALAGAGRVAALILVLIAIGSDVTAGNRDWMREEVFITKDDLMKLDPFESQRLDEADAAFENRSWRAAKAAYDAFLLEFPKSIAVPYALLRKGRAIQYDNKMKEALDTYTEIMDYFPNAIPYAGPTLYYMGQCQASQGKPRSAVELWREMAEDVDYRTHKFTAAAMNNLADLLHKEGKYDEAAKFYLQSATDFRRGDPGTVNHSISQMLRIWVRDKPDVKALRKVCKQLQGFVSNRPQGALEEDDQHFWDTIREQVRRWAAFPGEQKSDRAAYYQYWTKAMEGQQPKDDNFQKDLADFYLALDGKRDKWFGRLDKQFDAYQKAGDNERVAKWMLYYANDQKKLEEYFRKLNTDTVENGVLVSLITALWRIEAARPMSKTLYHKLHFNKMPDTDKGQLASDLYTVDRCFEEAEPIVLDLFGRFSNTDLGRMEELRYWGRGGLPRAAERGVQLADECVKVPQYAKEAYWIKGDCLMKLRRVDEAIGAYRATDDMPRNLFTIASCLVGQGKHAAAVSELSQIEGSGAFPREAPQAAMMIAQVWKQAGQKNLYISALTAVIGKYPNTTQSSDAHNALEDMGRSHLIRGGEDAK